MIVLDNLIKAYELTKNWILGSGIQNNNKGKRFDGGFNSWFDIKNKKYEYVYSEITGYGITTLLYINQKDSMQIALEKAKLSANWLIGNAIDKDGGVKTRLYYDLEMEKESPNSFTNRTQYTFDTGMALYGLINLYKITKKESYVEYITNLINFIKKNK